MKLVRESLGLGQKRHLLLRQQRVDQSARSVKRAARTHRRPKRTDGPISAARGGRPGGHEEPHETSSSKAASSSSPRCHAFSDESSPGRLGSPWEAASPLGETSRIGKFYIRMLRGPLRYVPMILTQLAFIPMLYSYVTFSILEQIGVNVPRAFATLFGSLFAVVSPGLGQLARRSAGWLLQGQLPLNASDELLWKCVLQILLPLIPVAYFLVVMPLVDIVLGRYGGNQAERKSISKKKQKQKRESATAAVAGKENDTGHRLILWAFGIIYISLFSMSVAMAASVPSLLSIATLSIGLGFYGSILITVSHELLHSSHSTDRFLSKVLLSLVCNLHWQKAHTLIHHPKVATLDDPASAYRGQNVYSFIRRSVFESWQILMQMDQVDKVTKASWVAVPLLLSLFLFLTCGLKGLALFLGSSVVAVVMLEIVNYIQHYGLERKLLPSGKYEQVSTKHSWNADWLFTNCHIIDLQLHGDHHLNATVPYYKLGNINEGPQMPAPYPVMLVMSLVPPLWFHVMDRRIDEYQQRTAAA